MRLVQVVGYLAHCETDPTSIVINMKTNSDASKTLYLGLDVHKEETVIAILESERDTQSQNYGSITTTQDSRKTTNVLAVIQSASHKISSLS